MQNVWMTDAWPQPTAIWQMVLFGSNIEAIDAWK
jgi:hypothetical protein